MIAAGPQLVWNRRSLWSRLRKALNPPRRYYRCANCGVVVMRRWLRGAPEIHRQHDFPGGWYAVPASSLAARKKAMGA